MQRTAHARVRKNISIFAALLLLFCTVFVWWQVFTQGKHDELSVTFFDVGQGDAIFIEASNGVQVLIDGGRGRSVLRELGRHMSFFDRSIDVVLATHPDLDHIGGLPYVLERYAVGIYISSGVEHDSSAVVELTEVLTQKGIEATYAKTGMYIPLDEETVLEVLFPDRDVALLESNTASVVTRLRHKDVSFLFTGDAPAGIEAYLVDLYGSELESDVLKLGHHGSKTSSSELFLGVIDPQYAVISAGCDNSYGHPHQIVLSRLAQFEIDYRETCTEGSVTFVTDGTNVYQK